MSILINVPFVVIIFLIVFVLKLCGLSFLLSSLLFFSAILHTQICTVSGNSVNKATFHNGNDTHEVIICYMLSDIKNRVRILRKLLVVEETNKTACGKGEKTSSTKKFKHIKSDLKAAQEQVRSNELYKKMEAEYQATIVKMQKRIEELEENIKRRMACMNSLPTYLRLIE
ncbi:hypothetical protein pdam_00019611 [Pocillopora damicornis]|uniref:Uncharacterized protein n=1 Tax=Pocillopora damicornis TaxID=46731 RepID=A0A3M6TKE6_POCDA|nr:hypothetical protein pdam_00019611 [Pocillopora damicornis]